MARHRYDTTTSDGTKDRPVGSVAGGRRGVSERVYEFEPLDAWPSAGLLPEAAFFSSAARFL